MMAIQERETDAMPSKSLVLLKSLALFEKLSDKEISHFAEAAQVRSFRKGQYLFMEGEQAQCFYVICSGWIKLLHVTQDGEEVVIAMLTRNNITGESAIFEHGNFASSAQVVEDAQILSIPLALLKERMQANSQLAINMLSSMVQYKRQHELQLEQYLHYSAPQRVGCFILGLCPVQKQKDGVVLDLPYDKTLIASSLGMKGPTFSRAMNVLRDEAGTRISGSRVTIDSIKRLLTFVDGCYSPHNLYEDS